MLATAAAAAASAAASRLLALTLLIDPFALSSPLTGSPCGDGCGECLPPVNSRTPNVLLIGDSISMGSYGYAWPVRRMLANNDSRLATVAHAGGFGAGGQWASSSKMHGCLHGPYLGDHRYDVVTINAGIHDCAEYYSTTNETQYAGNLRGIFRSLRQHTPRVVFVTTTPVPTLAVEPPSTLHRGCIARRNALAKDVVAEPEFAGLVSLCDLHDAVTRFCGSNYSDPSTGLGRCPIQRSDDVHFFTKWPFPSGQQYTALKVVQAILPHLPKGKIRCPWRNCTWGDDRSRAVAQQQRLGVTCPPAHELGGVRLAGHIVGFSKSCTSFDACCGEARLLGATSFTFNTNASHTPRDPSCRMFGQLESAAEWDWNCSTCISFAANFSVHAEASKLPPTVPKTNNSRWSVGRSAAVASDALRPPPWNGPCRHYKTCGPAPAPLNRTVPNVLIIGDSIADSGSGYGPLVRSLIEDPARYQFCADSTVRANASAGECLNDVNYPPGALAAVHHNGGWFVERNGSQNPAAFEQSGSACHLRKCLGVYLGTGGFDVISFNAGIHGCETGDQALTDADYKADILAIYDQIAKALAPGGTVVWTTTTPIATDSRVSHIDPACIPRRNSIAASALRDKPQLVVNDLYAAVTAVCGSNFKLGECPIQNGGPATAGPNASTATGGMHFNAAGRQLTALVTAQAIVSQLGPGWARMNCSWAGATSNSTARCTGWPAGE